jgi:carbamoyltransferase
MLIAGVNTGRTRDGLHHLKDGGACLLADGEIVVGIAEERLTREKHAGGFERSLAYCLSVAGCELSDLDMIVVSSCAEEPLVDGCDIGLPIDRSKIRAIPSHHLSHAYASFLPSPFAEAVIVIFDNEGSLIGTPRADAYWDCRVERNSYYVGRGTTITELESADDDLSESELGPGEAYRHFTYFLGWHSYVYAGLTMGLAPYGSRDTFRNLKVFDLKDGQIHSLLSNGRDDPSAAVAALGLAAGLQLGPRRGANEVITPRHCDLAATIQDELEQALVYKAQALHRMTGLTNLCIGGGLALNCVANRKILDQTPFERIYVCPAPGDSGQSLGNALYGWTKLAGQSTNRPKVRPYLGRSYSESDLRSAIAAADQPVTSVRSSDIAVDAARLVAEGHVIAWCQGGSEFGPRALGDRSILADPRPAAMQDYLNIVVKHREAFRPYAPSILEDEVTRFYDLPQSSRYMELTAVARPEVRHQIPAVTHVDGSARPQTVTREENELLERLLQEFQRLTGLPLVLNTSFNLAGEPIVESPADAVACFLRSELDALILGDFVVRRQHASSEPGFQKWAASKGAVSSI